MRPRNATDTFRIALAQMRVDGGRKEENLTRAESRIAEAARDGAQVVLLPEALSLGWTHSSAASEAEPIPGGQSCRRLAQCAQRHSVYVCAGLVEREGDQVFNAAVLIGPGGKLLLHHRKIHELDIAHDCYACGDRLQVVRTEFGTFGLMICADAFVPGQVLSRSLALMGAQIILSPCAWAVPAEHDNETEPYGRLWRDNYGPVARDFNVWIAGVSNVGWINGGPWHGRKCIGCSLLIGPDGNQALMAPYGVDADIILYADVKLTPRQRRAPKSSHQLSS